MSHPSLVNENFAPNIPEKFAHEWLSSEVFPADYYDDAYGNISLERFVKDYIQLYRDLGSNIVSVLRTN
jgi:hypothetical protein